MDHFWKLIEIEEIELDTSEQKHEIVILLRGLNRPQCLFGWKVPAVEEYDFESDRLNDDRNVRDAAEVYATIIAANLQEKVLATGHGLPKDCSPDGVTWF